MNSFVFNFALKEFKRIANFKMSKIPLQINSSFLILKFAIPILVVTILILKVKWYYGASSCLSWDSDCAFWVATPQDLCWGIQELQVLFYGCETLTLTDDLKRLLDSFVANSLGKLLRYRWYFKSNHRGTYSLKCFFSDFLYFLPNMS